MSQRLESKQKLEDFINKLSSIGYGIQEVRKKPQIYAINNKLVNIRSRSRHKNNAWGKSFWYDVNFGVLQEVKWVIYLMTSADYFMMFPRIFFEDIKDRMYPSRSNPEVGVFDIDWDNEMLVLKQGDLISIKEYYHNLVHQEDFPRF